MTVSKCGFNVFFQELGKSDNPPKCQSDLVQNYCVRYSHSISRSGSLFFLKILFELVDLRTEAYFNACLFCLFDCPISCCLATSKIYKLVASQLRRFKACCLATAEGVLLVWNLSCAVVSTPFTNFPIRIVSATSTNTWNTGVCWVKSLRNIHFRFVVYWIAMGSVTRCCIPGVSKLRPAGQIRPAKPFHAIRKDTLTIIKK